MSLEEFVNIQKKFFSTIKLNIFTPFVLQDLANKHGRICQKSGKILFNKKIKYFPSFSPTRPWQ
jgi:hypothetical protein